MATTNIILKHGDTLTVTVEPDPVVTPPVVTPPITGRAFYVSSAGNDKNNGTSEAMPWKTISKVNSATFLKGDNILFRKGDLWKGNINVKTAGITYSAYGDGNLPAFVSAGDFWTPIINIDGKADVVIDGLKLFDDTMSVTDHSIPSKFAYGIFIKNSPRCVVKNCDISLVGNGVNIGGTSNNTIITKNFMHNFRMVVNTPGGDDDYGANPIILTTSDNVISYNRFEECWGNSYDYGFDGGAVEFYGTTVNNNVIMYNTAINCNGFLEIGSGSAGTANNNVVAYNKIINCGVVGILNNSGNFAVSINNLQYYNNTIVETKKQFTVPGVMFDMFVKGHAGMLVLKNNIFYTSNGTNIYTSEFAGSVAIHTNNIYRMANGSVGIPLHSTEKLMNNAIIFTSTNGDPSGWDYSPAANSPAINFGVQVGYTKDFNGNNITGLPDAGILEKI